MPVWPGVVSFGGGPKEGRALRHFLKNSGRGVREKVGDLYLIMRRSSFFPLGNQGKTTWKGPNGNFVEGGVKHPLPKKTHLGTKKHLNVVCCPENSGMSKHKLS